MYFNYEDTVEQMVLDALCVGVSSNMAAKKLVSYRDGNNDKERLNEV
jgi:hypothetical protein